MESLQPLLDNFLKDYPDMREKVASLIGYTTGKLLGGDEETGYWFYCGMELDKV